MEEYYLGLLRHDNPQHPIVSFAFLGGGEDHLAFVVNGDWIFRFARDVAACRETTRDEAALLTFLHDRSLLPVPLPVYRNEAHSYLSYQQLAGVPLLGVREQFDVQDWSTFPQAIGAFLTAIHATPLHLVEAFIYEDPIALADWLEEAQTTFAEARGVIPPSLWPRIEGFLSAPIPSDIYTPALMHNDLGIEHILVEPASRRITGIIDWGDAAIADPAYDFGKL